MLTRESKFASISHFIIKGTLTSQTFGKQFKSAILITFKELQISSQISLMSLDANEILFLLIAVFIWDLTGVLYM